LSCRVKDHPPRVFPRNIEAEDALIESGRPDSQTHRHVQYCKAPMHADAWYRRMAESVPLSYDEIMRMDLRDKPNYRARVPSSPAPNGAKARNSQRRS
jgi:hypothetical protein